jgi:hypothetical protein
MHIPNVSDNAKIYDSKLVSTMKVIADGLPEGAVVVASANGPQTEYLTERTIKIPRGVDSLKSLVEYMWRNNSTYLIVFVSQSSEEMLGPIFSRSGVQHLEKPFDKVANYTTDTNDINLYRLRSNVTRDNLTVVADHTKPAVTIMSPINNTVIETARKQAPFQIHVTGTASDIGSQVEFVEVFVEDFPYKPAKPRAPDDWSEWSYSDVVTSEGDKLIVARATDSAGNMQWYDVVVTVHSANEVRP